MGREDNHLEEYRRLLQSLKGTAEGLLISQVSNVWNVYGGLNRLHHVMENIFKHGCRVFNQDGDPDCWIFIQGLSWLKPSLAVSPTFVAEIEENNHQLPPNVNEKALVWLYKSLEGHTLSQKLSWLLSDREHLLSCFEKTAYLCQEKYGEATLICLRAVEQNQPSLLTEIDPCLYLSSWNPKPFHKSHRRCSSFPETQYSAWHMIRNRGVRFEKQPSEDSHLLSATACSTVDNTPAGDGRMVTLNGSKDFGDSSNVVDKPVNSVNSGSSNNLTEGEKLPSSSVSDTSCHLLSEGKLTDTLSNHANITLKCDKQVECVAASSNQVNVNDIVVSVGDVDTGKMIEQDNESLCEEAMDCTVLCDRVEEKSVNVESECREKIKPLRQCKSLPSILRLCSTSEDVAARSSGSKTLPSSPIKCPSHSHSTVFSSSEPSTSLSETIPSPPSSKLSPSILKIDYMLESHSDVDHGHVGRDWRPVPIRFTSKNATNIKPATVEDTHVNSNVPVKRTTTMNSSGSSDTLNLDVGKSNDEKTSHPKEISKPNIRPNELKLWNVEDEDGKRRKKKNGVIGSAPEYAEEWLSGGNIVLGHRPLKKSFIEDGGSSVLPMATGFFPRPLQGQSLTSFLSSGQFARPSAELDRENAHFSISEAMIAAIEQVKCNRQLRVAEERGEVGDESDEEINHLKQRIRLRRRQRQQEKQNHLWGVSLLSDGKTDTTTTDQSVSPLSSSPGTPSESISTDDVDDLEVDEVKNLAQLRNSGLSVSMASLYSEADLSKHPPARTGTDLAVTESVVSAEGVALSLLRQFSEKQLPRASDLEWLVSEQDAPQQLLPLPTSWPISPDEAEDADMRQATPLRGTMEWAPPRPQVIFTAHPTPVRRVLMAKQNYRCAGCGMKVAMEYSHRFRYCEYLGRYFCTGCHTNQVALIPGRVLAKWDFNRYPVSNFSYRLLDQMMGDALFRIADLNPCLYRKTRQLERTRQLRLQLFYLKDFILSCRFAELLQDELQKEAPYVLTEPDVFSLQDLLQVKSGELPTRLRELISCCSQHVADCQLCSARGFVCELCTSQEVIFPWQLTKVTRCPTCGACFHAACWTPSPCPRCRRLTARRTSRSEEEL
ncbi:run domain Beclin-1-interacting and cysteine-rich domain-containing protein [Anabrus simplex]|uniref:run domain Beclin-1-interacting and cysteine-rich domain-containing protein n=1 Tax=Anabrus simplex TaxID=316456 RepID=UPI0035A38A35